MFTPKSRAGGDAVVACIKILVLAWRDEKPFVRWPVDLPPT
jgi:hypothetical protein